MGPRRSRPRWQRIVAACLAAWFAVASADLPALHACGMHVGGTVMIGTAAAADVGTAHADMPGTMAHATAGHAPRHAHGPAHGLTHAGHLCTCLGACCGASAATRPGLATLVLQPAVPTPRVAPGRPSHEYVAAWVDFVLPFATAPPRPAST